MTTFFGALMMFMNVSILTIITLIKNMDNSNRRTNNVYRMFIAYILANTLWTVVTTILLH